MSLVVSSIAAIFVILPILFYILIFVIMKQTTKNHKMAKSSAINVTTFLLVFSVHYLILTIWSKSMLWLIVLFLLLTAIIFTFIYWKIREEIIYRKVFQGYLRLNFVLFSLLYLGLLLYGVTTRAIEAIVST